MDNFLKAGAETLKQKNGFIKQLPLEVSIENRRGSSSSSGSIQSEMHHFKPIKIAPRTPPKQYPDGKVVEIRLTKVTPLKTPAASEPPELCLPGKITIENKKLHSPYSAFKGKAMPCVESDSYESPRKRIRFSSDETETGVLKEITLGENSDSNSMSTSDVDLKIHEEKKVAKQSNSHKKTSQNNFNVPSKKLFNLDQSDGNSTEGIENDQFDTQDYLSPEPVLEEKLVEEQRRIEQLILQEKADRELALKLSREWERRYELRKKPKSAANTRSSIGFNNKKMQQTLLDAVVTKRKK